MQQPQPAWDEPRGPHLPDAVTRIPGPAWVFVAAAVLVAWRSVSWLAAGGTEDVGATLLNGTWIAGQVVACLIGAALFVRHPDALRTHRALAVGTALIALNVVGARIRADAGAWLDGLIADQGFIVNPLTVAFRTLLTLAVAGGVFALGRGLEAARALPVRRGAVPLMPVALAIVIATSAVRVLTFVVIADPGDFLVSNVIASATNLAVGLAWASLAVTATLGAKACEEPALGWQLAAIAAWGMLALGLGSALADWLLMAVPPAVTSAGPTIAAVFPILETAMWAVLLAAFATGLPSTEGPKASSFGNSREVCPEVERAGSQGT